MNNKTPEQLIAGTPTPVTLASLEKDFSRLGVRPGMVLLVHASLSSLGWVCGGPVAVIQALEKLLGEKGTLVMPAFSGELSEPSFWVNPPVPARWWPIIRENMPAFDKNLTPTRKMGAVAETFRKQDGVMRSEHPQVSFIARGKAAKFITADHELNYIFGETSPVAKIYELGG
jgi:aminoglycoside 3-N-acetyltransferase